MLSQPKPRTDRDSPPVRLIVCVGMTKAGTSWFYGYLRNHPDAFMRGVKEYNYFGHEKIPYRNRHLTNMAKRATALTAQIKSKGWAAREDDRRFAPVLQEWVRLNRDFRRPTADEFMHHLTDGVTGEAVVADVSPGYGLLDAEDYADMIATAEDVRLVCFLRDPVARAWSEMRMRAERRSKKPEDVPRIANRIFRNCFEGGSEDPPGRLLDLSRYSEILPKMMDGAGDKIDFYFYESLFDPEDKGAELARRSAFLDLEARPGELTQVRHQGTAVSIAPRRLNTARRAMAADYIYCAETFGDRLPQTWRRAMEEAKISH